MEILYGTQKLKQDVYEKLSKEPHSILLESIITNRANVDWLTRNLITLTSHQVVVKLMDYFKSEFKLLEPVKQADGKILIRFNENCSKLMEQYNFQKYIDS